MTTTGVFQLLNQVFQLVLTVFLDCTNTIMENPLLLVPILISIGGMIIFFGVSVFKRLGVKGVSSSGRRRRRR